MTSVRSLGGIACVLSITACGGSAPARWPASSLARSEAVPAGYEALGAVRAECVRRPPAGAFQSAPSTSFACSRAELERALLEQAASRGGTVLAAERCRGRASSKLVCTAVAARPAQVAGRAPEGEGAPADEALPAVVASRILIDLEPKGAPLERRPRQPEDVTEFRLLPVGHVERGVMRAHCHEGDCDTDEVRAGLRAAAGGLGVSDLVGVRCFAFAGEASCVATIAESERDPETDPRAR